MWKLLSWIKYYFSYGRELRLIIKAQVDSLQVEQGRKITILDVGCGTTSMLSELVRDQSLRSRYHCVGLDVYAPTIEWNRVNGFHDEYVLCDVREHAPFDKYDVVVATDLIEHFEKPDALALVKKLESIARRKIIMITPNGYQENLPQDDNIYMLHKCGFDVDDFKSLAYIVSGAGGFRFLRGMYSLPKGNTKIMNFLLYFLSRALRVFPRVSYHLIAAKKLS